MRGIHCQFYIFVSLLTSLFVSHFGLPAIVRQIDLDLSFYFQDGYKTVKIRG